VFIEPLETIEQNNELVRLMEDEHAEVRRILLEMTQRIGERSAEIARALEVLSELELQFVKAKFAEDYNCVAPVLTSSEVAPPLSLPGLERQHGEVWNSRARNSHGSSRVRCCAGGYRRLSVH